MIENYEKRVVGGAPAKSPDPHKKAKAAPPVQREGKSERDA